MNRMHGFAVVAGLVGAIASVLPLVHGQTAPAAGTDKTRATVIVVELLDGSAITGRASFDITLRTMYGKLAIPAAKLVSATLDHKKGTAEVAAIDLQVTGAFVLPDLQLRSAIGPLAIASKHIRKLSRVTPPLGPGWRSLLSPAELKQWRPAPRPDPKGVFRFVTPTDTWGAAYRAGLPTRWEFTVDVKCAPGARTDVHVAHGDGTAYIRASDVARAKTGQWVNVRFVQDRGLTAYVDGKKVPFERWRDARDPCTIGLSSDHAESQFRRLRLKELAEEP